MARTPDQVEHDLEDSFPASDPPSWSPSTASPGKDVPPATHETGPEAERRDPSNRPSHSGTAIPDQNAKPENPGKKSPPGA
jgi:hypothetical protein